MPAGRHHRRSHSRRRLTNAKEQLAERLASSISNVETIMRRNHVSETRCSSTQTTPERCSIWGVRLRAWAGQTKPSSHTTRARTPSTPATMPSGHAKQSNVLQREPVLLPNNPSSARDQLRRFTIDERQHQNDDCCSDDKK